MEDPSRPREEEMIATNLKNKKKSFPQRLLNEPNFEGWIDYLSNQVQSERLHNHIVEFFFAMEEKDLAISLPNGATITEYGFQMRWETPTSYLLIDIAEDGALEVFIENSRTKKYRGEENCSYEVVRNFIVEHLKTL